MLWCSNAQNSSDKVHVGSLEVCKYSFPAYDWNNSYEGRLISSWNCFFTETRNRKRENKIHPKIRLLKTDLEVKYYLDMLKIKVYMKQ